MARNRSEPTAWQRYKMSPVRFAILFVLVVVALVMGYMLYQKMQREGISQGAIRTPALA